VPSFSKKSQAILETCNIDIQRVFNMAIKFIDMKPLEGYRSPGKQFEYYKKGRKQLEDGTWEKIGSTITNIDGIKRKGNHNYEPSRAIDIVPYPVDWKDINRFFRMAGIVQVIAVDLAVTLDWGGDWTRFKDYPHFELKEND